jgi:hypothetical protein
MPLCVRTEHLLAAILSSTSSIVVGISRAPIRNEQGEMVGIVETGRALTMNSVETLSEGQLKQTIDKCPWRCGPPT